MSAVDDLNQIGRSLKRARSRVSEVLGEAERAAKDAIAAGATEVHVAEALGVNRMTVRKWMGKR